VTAAITSNHGAAAGLADLSWDPRPEVALPLVVAGGLYALGWWRLSHRNPRARSAASLACALGGLAAIAVALLSPLDALADRLFVAHMLQHMLLIMVAAPALLLANPFPVVLWALPGPVRRRVGRRLTRASLFGRVWRGATAMPFAWLAAAGILWLWHLPLAYDAALSDRVLHDLEHVSFFIGGLLFWCPVIHPAPRFREPAPPVLRIVYLVLGAFQTSTLGLLLTLAPVVLYRSYATLDDQAWGGVVMWGVGGLIEMIAVLLLLHRCLGPGAGRDAAAQRGNGHAGSLDRNPSIVGHRSIHT
jgi:cytochrome c oxidase assembly factor CtaG